MKHQLCILVTGAASGIGRAIAIKFSREGWSVLGVDLNGKELDQTRQLTLGHPGGFEGLELDITETSAPERAVKLKLIEFHRCSLRCHGFSSKCHEFSWKCHGCS